MQLSTLDGFMTGIAAVPARFRPSNWLPRIWGGVPPGFSDADQEKAILGSIFHRYDEIRLGMRHPEEFEPIFWIDDRGRIIAADWVDGLLAAMRFCEPAWQVLLKDPEIHELVATILVMSAPPNSSDGVVPATVEGIRQYWLRRRRQEAPWKQLRRPERWGRTGQR